MLEAKCSKCGTYRSGWALLNPRYQTCPKCGEGLDITEDGHKVFKGYSPFTAKKLPINPPPNASPTLDKNKDKQGQKE